MVYERLLAKSCVASESCWLPVHLMDAYSAAKQVLLATADDQLRALGLQLELKPRFHQITLLAAALHDLGKANDHFLGMIRRERDLEVNPQGIRHEWVTILMIQRLRGWLKSPLFSDKDIMLAEWAIAGHHPKHNHPSPPKDSPDGSVR